MSLYSSLSQVLAPYAVKLNGLLTGWNGTVYSTPGEAVRQQIADLHVLIGDEPGTAINASAVGYEDGSVADALDGLNGRLTQLPFVDVTAEADMTDTARIYRYDGALWFYNGSEWAKIGTGSGGSGGAVVVTNASDMTDTTLIYLYEGSETGYTAGHFYYNNGTAWVDGGLYYVGRDGTNGTNGQDGQDGFSPVATVETTSTGVRISITDKNGTTTAQVENGTATDAQVADWLDNHPEATTTVEDGSITDAKLSASLKETIESGGSDGFDLIVDSNGNGILAKVYYLYNEGDEYAGRTGGWELRSTFRGSTDYGSYSEESDHLHLGLDNAPASAVCGLLMTTVNKFKFKAGDVIRIRAVARKGSSGAASARIYLSPTANQTNTGINKNTDTWRTNTLTSAYESYKIYQEASNAKTTQQNLEFTVASDIEAYLCFESLCTYESNLTKMETYWDVYEVKVVRE